MAFLKRTSGARLAASVAVALLAVAPAHALQVGDRFEPLELRDIAGEPVTLDPTATPVLLVDIWASWCRPCREALPALAEFSRAIADPRLRIAAIGIDRDREVAKRFLDEVLSGNGDGLVLYHDGAGAVPARIGAPGMPTTVLVVDGVVRSIEAGFAPEPWADLRARVRAALAAQPATDSPPAPR